MKKYFSVRLGLWLPAFILCVFVAMMVASSIWQYRQLSAELETRTVRLIQARMSNMQHRLDSLLRLQQGSLVAEEIAELGALPEVDYLALLSDSQQVLYATRRPWLGKSASAVMDSFDSGSFERTRLHRQPTIKLDASGNKILAYQPISLATLPDQIRPTQVGVLLLKYDLVLAKEEIRQQAIRRSVSEIAIGSLAMLLLMWAMRRWLTSPLGYLRDTVNRISSGDFSSRVELSGKGELAELGAAINKMQADLADSMQRLRTSNEELAASEENLAVTLNSIGDAVITTDMAGKVTQLNPVAQQLTGWSLADAQGAPLDAVFHIINSQTRQPAANPVHQVLKTGQIVGLANHTSLIARDGREYHIADSAAPIRDQNGHSSGVVLVFHDVSEQYRQQAERAERAAELKKITDILPGPVTRVDAEGRYVFVSSVYQDWFGKRAEEVVGSSQRAALGEEIHAQMEPWFMRAMAGEKASFELTLPDPSNGVRHALMHVIPDFCADGAVAGYYTIATDITQRKRAEQDALALRDQLLQATKMEAVGHLTAGIAHDFNNMLGAIMGNAEIAQHVLASGKAGDGSAYLAAILKAGNRARELIAQMLTFSRKSGTVADDTPVAELAPIIREVLALLRSSIPSSISINCLIEDENIRARIHAVQMHQILVNLGINARDAITQYGRIDITLAIVRGNEAVCASCQHVFAGDYAQITVQDSGSGIAGEIMGNIFNPFFTTKEVGKGTGMGLAVVHGLVHAVAGHIMVQSSEAGTAISILLPLAESQAKAQAPLQHELPQSLHVLSGSRIMVVDDEPAMSEMMCDMLSLHGATVSMYNDPLNAMASFRIDPHAVDLVLTDETMPGMSGLHLARNMLDVRPDLKVVLYTGYSENVDADTCGAQGLAGFFYKPVKMNELLLKLQQLLQDGK